MFGNPWRHYVRSVRNRLALVLLLPVLALTVAVSGCGSSKSDKAKKQVCDASADIQKQVKSLQGLTLSTATTSQVKDSLNAISSDLSKITDAQGDLNDERKKQVQSANQQFTSEVKSVVSNLGTNLSLSNAQAQLTKAFQQLASAYQKTFAQVDCS
jgi:valyl-tRNA synthetase